MVTDDSNGQLIRQYLQVLKRRWGIIVLVVLVAAVSAGVVTLRMKPTYQAAAQVSVAPFFTPSTSGGDPILEDPSLLQTDVQLIESDVVLSLAAQALGLKSASQLRGAITASSLNGTQILEVQATAGNGKTAAAWAEAAAKAFISFQRDQAIAQVTATGADISAKLTAAKAALAALNASGTSAASATAVQALQDQITSLEGQQAQLPGMNAITGGVGSIVEDASVPTLPTGPKKKQNVALGAVVGLLLAVGLVLLIESLDDRIRSGDEVEKIAKTPILGSVPFTRELTKPSEAAALVHNPTSPIGEAYRSLRTNLRFLSVENPLQTLLVTSSVKGEGKSTTAANLAAAFAVSGVRTILVSADLRRPSVHRYFGLQNSVGVVDAVLPDVALERLLQANEIPDLRVLAAGRIPPNPTEILASTRFAEVIDVLRAGSDLVIIDTPPVLGLADASALASRVDGVLLVVNPNEVNRRTLAQARTQLERAGGNVLGVLLNSVGPSMGYGYGYEYGYYSPTPESDRKARKSWQQEEKGARPKKSRNLPQPSVSSGARPSASRQATGATLARRPEREVEAEFGDWQAEAQGNGGRPAIREGRRD